MAKQIDTVLEENDPAMLDFSKHQLFIDTTRNSQRYEQILSWNPHDYDNEAINYYMAEIAKRYSVVHVDLKNFPRKWISLKKLNGSFVVYDPCDGNTPSYSFTDSLLHFFGQLEADADLYSNLISVSNNSIELELHTIPQKSITEKAIVTVKPYSIENVYQLIYTCGDHEEILYIAPTTHVKMFDMVVNHCPETKRREFNGFD